MDNPTWMYRRLDDGGVEARLFAGPRLARTVDGWRDSPARLPEPFAGMSKKELEAYARVRFGVELDRRRGLGTLRRQLRRLAAQQGTGEGRHDHGA